MNGNQFQSMFISHCTKFRQTCHRTVIAHYFHQSTCRVKSGKACHIDGSFCMSGTTKYSFFLCIQRINMSGTSESSRCRSRIGQRLNSSSTVGSRNSGTTTFQFVNCHCKRSAQYRSIITDLMRQIQFFTTRHRDRRTEHTTRMFQHKVNFLRSYLFGSYD